LIQLRRKAWLARSWRRAPANLNSSPQKRPALDPIQLALQRRAERYSVARLPALSDSLTGEGDSLPGAANSDLVMAALAARGIRYRWGGASRGGFDCSGFTRYLFKELRGVTLPHSASRQARIGEKVPREALKEGDLVFFSTYRRGISHVGIYIGGNRFVHAANRRKDVRVDTLTGYYGRRYKTARRIGARLGGPLAQPIAGPPGPEDPSFSSVEELPGRDPAESTTLKSESVSIEISVAHGEAEADPEAHSPPTGETMPECR
jgi:cell wall-associated NlpC family hydrolase